MYFGVKQVGVSGPGVEMRCGISIARSPTSMRKLVFQIPSRPIELARDLRHRLPRQVRSQRNEMCSKPRGYLRRRCLIDTRQVSPSRCAFGRNARIRKVRSWGSLSPSPLSSVIPPIRPRSSDWDELVESAALTSGNDSSLNMLRICTCMFKQGKARAQSSRSWTLCSALFREGRLSRGHTQS